MKISIIILAVLAAIVILLGSGMFKLPFFLSPQAVSIKANQLSGSSMRMAVDFSDYLNLKNDAGCNYAVIVTDSDIPTDQATCAKWEGSYSTSQGVCDIGKIATGASINNNAIAFRGKTVDASIVGTRLVLCLKIADAGCTSTEVYNDQCTGRVSGYITFNAPTTQPTPYCGDGTCDSGETQSSCPSDCGTTPQPYCGDGACGSGETQLNCPSDCGSPSPPPASNPFQFIIDWINAFLAWIRSLFGIS